MLNIETNQEYRTPITIHKIKDSLGMYVYILKSMYGTPYLYQFENVEEAKAWALKNNCMIVNLHKEE